MTDGGPRSLLKLWLSLGSRRHTHSLFLGFGSQYWVSSTVAWGPTSLASFLSWRAGAWSSYTFRLCLNLNQLPWKKNCNLEILAAKTPPTA